MADEPAPAPEAAPDAAAPPPPWARRSGQAEPAPAPGVAIRRPPAPFPSLAAGSTAQTRRLAAPGPGSPSGPVGGPSSPTGRPGPAPRPAPTGLAVPKSGIIVGAVTGHPIPATEQREFFGSRVLVVAAVLAILMSVAFLLAAGPGGSGPLLGPIVVLLVVVGIGRAVTRVVGRRSGGQARGTPTKGARTKGVPNNGIWPAAARQPASGIGPAPATSRTVTVHRFRLTPVAGGAPIECVRYGDPRGHELRHGDFVAARARRTRHGYYVVGGLQILAAPTGPVIGQASAQPSRAFRLARLGNRVCLVLSGVLVLWVAFALVAILV